MEKSRDMDRDMTGKVCMVTGATSGIGRATAIALAKIGAKIVIVGRSQDKIIKLKQQLARLSTVEHESLLCDFTSLSDVCRAADEFVARGQALDVLVNNAGAIFLARQQTQDGFEATFAVNHLAPFQFTLKLLPALEQGKKARIVNVASDAYRFGGAIDFSDLGMQQDYNGIKAYSRSKLANILFTQVLAENLKGTTITVNCLHPGVVATNFLGNNRNILISIFRPLVGLFLKSPAKGAATSVYLATSPNVEGTTGGYFIDCKQARLGRVARDVSAAKQLWQISAELTGAQTM